MDEFMEAALEEARRGLAEGGVPIGAVLVKDGRIVGRGRNRRVQEGASVLHAEIDCLHSAGRVADYRGSTLYTTLMPCPMCTGAVVQMGIARVVAGESRTLAGAREIMEARGVEVLDLQLDQCSKMMREFIEKNGLLWAEEVGEI
ncbi:MAG: nucleoside deaminase [Methanosarcinales archaeon]|nr:nucleoside deaminase [Methanosarcinales archaeon]